MKLVGHFKGVEVYSEESMPKDKLIFFQNGIDALIVHDSTQKEARITLKEPKVVSIINIKGKTPLFKKLFPRNKS